MVVQATIKFKRTCLKNEEKLLQYIEDMNVSEVDLKSVIEHNIRKCKNIDNSIVNCDDKQPSDEMIKFDVTDSIEVYTECSKSILNLFWGEDSTIPIKVPEVDDLNDKVSELYV